MTKERAMQLMNNEESNLKVCVGSWKQYNECGKFGLGSYYNGTFYIDFVELEGSEELKDLLSFIGWSEADMEETFVQDYESEYVTIENCDNQCCFMLADLIYENRNTFEDEDELKKLSAIIQCVGLTMENALEEIDNYDLWRGTAEEYEEQLFYDCISKEMAELLDSNSYITIDFERMARDDEWIIDEIDFDYVTYTLTQR